MRPHKRTCICKTLLLTLSLLSGDAFGFDCVPWKYPPQSSEDLPSEQSNAWGGIEKAPSSLLWRITNSNGGISFLFGTIHLSDPRVIEFSQYVEPYLNRVQNFAMEVLITPEIPALLADKMFYSGGEKLADHLDPGVLPQTLELLSQHGLDQRSANRLKPWAAYMTLSVPPSEYSVPLDLHLLSHAKGRGMKLFGIEDIGEQLAIFEELEISEQISLLTEAICNYQENQAQVEVMLSAYLQENLVDLAKIGEQYLTPVNEHLLQRLIIQRNALMAQRMAIWLEGGGFFIAVGALHLTGETGLVNTLRKMGFLTEPVESDSP